MMEQWNDGTMGSGKWRIGLLIEFLLAGKLIELI
jgi:hypothetical protein